MKSIELFENIENAACKGNVEKMKMMLAGILLTRDFLPSVGHRVKWLPTALSLLDKLFLGEAFLKQVLETTCICSVGFVNPLNSNISCQPAQWSVVKCGMS